MNTLIKLAIFLEHLANVILFAIFPPFVGAALVGQNKKNKKLARHAILLWAMLPIVTIGLPICSQLLLK